VCEFVWCCFWCTSCAILWQAFFGFQREENGGSENNVAKRSLDSETTTMTRSLNALHHRNLIPSTTRLRTTPPSQKSDSFNDLIEYDSPRSQEVCGRCTQFKRYTQSIRSQEGSKTRGYGIVLQHDPNAEIVGSMGGKTHSLRRPWILAS